MIDSTERGSSLARMTPAGAMATSVPAPMAMPTSAWARAGASLTPSPTIETRALGLELLHGRSFWPQAGTPAK